MNKDQLRYWYEELRDNLNKSGKTNLLTDERLLSYCEFGSALIELMKLNNLELDLNHGEPKYDEETGSMIIGLVDAETKKPNGSINLLYNSLNVNFINRNELGEVYNTLYYNGKFSFGKLGKMVGETPKAVYMYENEYKIDDKTENYSSTDEVGKIQEIDHLLSSRVR